MQKVKIYIPSVFNFLFKNIRYKISYGGRGSGKSWAYARALIILALQKKHRILCSREMQNSISDSVHQLLRDQIEALGVSSCFEITQKEIECTITGSIFKFKGLHHNIDEIKSFEGVTICWVEEAEKVSEYSWSKLIPTIFRRENAQLWISFNTGYEDDATYERFIKNPPDNSIVKLVNFYDNPKFPKVLDEARKEDLKYRPLEYKNIWLGTPKGYGGKVWSQYIDSEYPNGHVRDFKWQQIEETANIIMACDPAQKYYHACIWIAIFPINNRKKYPDDFVKWIYAEYPDFDTFGDYFYRFRKTTLYPHTLSVFANEVLGKDASGHRLKCNKRFIDTRFATGSGSGNSWSSQTTGLIEQLAKPENGNLIFDLPPVKYIDTAKNDIIKDLQYNTADPMHEINCPNLYVASWCKNVRYSLFNHRVEESSEKENEKLKDFSDCLKIAYAGLKEFKYQDPLKVNSTMSAINLSLLNGKSRQNSWMG